MIFNHSKRIVALLLAFTLVFTPSMTAFASNDTAVNNNSIVIEVDPSESTEPPVDPSEPTEPPVSSSEATEPPVDPSEPTEPPVDPSDYDVVFEGIYDMGSEELSHFAMPLAPTSGALSRKRIPEYPIPPDFFITGAYYLQGDWLQWFIDGQLSYCLEPINFNSVDGSIYNPVEYHQLSLFQRKTIAQAMLYGEDTGANVPYHIATQVFIWEIVLGQVNPLTLEHIGVGGTKNSAYYIVSYHGLDGEYEKLKNKIRNHHKIPSFMTEHKRELEQDPFPYQVPTDGTALELVDENKLLADFNITDGDGYSFVTNGNTLEVYAEETATETYDPKIDSETLKDKFAPSMVFYGSGSQQVKAIAVKDPAQAYMRLTIGEGGSPPPPDQTVEITLRKADPEHFHPSDYNTPQVEFTDKVIDNGFDNLSGAGIRVTGTGTGTGEYVLPCTIELGAGTFEITEIMAPNGYIINKDFRATVTVEIPKPPEPPVPPPPEPPEPPKPVVTIEVKNGTIKGNYENDHRPNGDNDIVLLDNRQKGELTITKIDFENNYINHNDEHIAQGNATFEGAVFGLYASEDIILPTSGIKIYDKDELVVKATTDENGAFTIPEIELGNYYLQELVPSTGYVFKNEEMKGHIYTVDNPYSPMNGGELDPQPTNILSLNKPDENADFTGDKNEYENTVIKGDLTIIKHLEDDEVSNESDLPHPDKPKAEGIYFGVYLKSKAEDGNNPIYVEKNEVEGDGTNDSSHTEKYGELDLVNDNYYSPLPDDYFVQKPLDPNNLPQFKNPSIIDGATEPTDPTQVADKDLYMVMRTNKDGYCSTLDPSTIVWSIARAGQEPFGNQLEDGGLSLGFPQKDPTSPHPPLFNGDEKGGKVNNMQLPYGNYTVVELNPHEGYAPIMFDVFIGRDPANPDKVEDKPNIGEDYPYNKSFNNFEYVFTFENKVLKQKITVVKTDSETGKVIPQAGITYKIWSWDNTTNNNVTGGASTEHPIRPYHKEINGKMNILVPPTVDLNYSDVTLKVGDEVDKPIVTLDYDTPSNTLLANGRPQITWTNEEKAIINKDFSNLTISIEDTSIAKIDFTGKLVALKEGTTTFEVLLPYDFEPFKGTITVDTTTATPVTDSPKKYECDGHFIEQKIEYPSGEIVSEFKTDETGSFTLNNPLVYGDYLLYEKLAPHGYVISFDPFPFTVAKSNSTIPNIYLNIEIKQSNTTQKGIIQIEKYGDVLTGAENYITLLGKTALKPVWEKMLISADFATFELYAREDIITPEGTKYYSKDELIQTINTDITGTAKSKQLPLGAYYIKEIKAPNGYVVDTEIHNIDLVYAGQTINITPVFSPVENTRQNVKIEILKNFKTKNGSIVPANDVYFGLFANEHFALDKIEVDYPEQPYSISLNRSNIVMQIGDTVGLELAIEPLQADQTHTVFGYDSNMIHYDETTGNITALAIGQTPIRISTPTGLLVIGTIEISLDTPTVPTAIKVTDIDENYPIDPDFSVDPMNIVIPKDSLMEVIRITDGKGYSSLELPVGKYYIQELKAPSDYILDDTKYEIEFKNSPNGNAVVTMPVNGGKPIINYPTDPPINPPDPPEPPEPPVIGEVVLFYDPKGNVTDKNNPNTGADYPLFDVLYELGYIKTKDWGDEHEED